MPTNPEKDGLWALGFGALGATLKGMQDAGITLEMLARFRSIAPADKKWAKEVARTMRGASGAKQEVQPLPSLLRLIRTEKVVGAKLFTAREFFKERWESPSLPLRLSRRFSACFWDNGGLIEQNLPDVDLNVYVLEEHSANGPIMRVLGGYVARTSLLTVARLIGIQRHGQKGVLLTSGGSNIFYIEDANQELWVVTCRWIFGEGGYWFADAAPFSGVEDWDPGTRVFSAALVA